MDNDVDLILVCGGTNDYWHNQTLLGTLGSIDTSTFYGAVETLITGLINKYPNKKIAFITPFNQYYNGVSCYTKNSYANANLDDFVNVVIELCKIHSIPVLDLFHSSGLDVAHNINVKDLYTQDGVHPNNTGMMYMAHKVVNFINNL
jgi:lysophospholipase L1-like esterase